MDFPADITLKKTRMKFWIERSRLFCYSVIKVLCFLPRKLSYYITSLHSCQELFSKKTFHLLVKIPVLCDANFCMLSHVPYPVKKFFNISFQNPYIFQAKMCFSCATHIILSQQHALVKHFLNIFSFLSRTLDIVLFLYFYHFYHMFNLLNCYFFINFICSQTTIFLITSNLHSKTGTPKERRSPIFVVLH